MKTRNIIAPIIVVIIVIAAVAAYAYFSSTGTGTLTIEMRDPPADWNGATQIYIRYSAIEVHRQDVANVSAGWTTAITNSAWLNLTQTLSVNKTLGSVNLPPATYNLIRFSLLNATVTIGGVNKTATVPPNTLQIAITEGGIKVNAGQTSALLVELNMKITGSDSTGFNIVPDVRAVPVSSMGALKVQITDPPVAWNGTTQIYLNYSAIEVHRADAANGSVGWFTVVNKSAWLNLTRTLSLNQTIGSTNLQNGTYNLIRFKLFGAKITIGGQNFTATVPPDMLQIAITQGGVEVKAGETSTLLIELNISVTGSSSSGYHIVPDVRAIPV